MSGVDLISFSHDDRPIAFDISIPHFHPAMRNMMTGKTNYIVVKSRGGGRGQSWRKLRGGYSPYEYFCMDISRKITQMLQRNIMNNNLFQLLEAFMKSSHRFDWESLILITPDCSNKNYVSCTIIYRK